MPPQAAPSPITDTSASINARVNGQIARLQAESEAIVAAAGGSPSHAVMVRLDALLKAADAELGKRLASWAQRNGGDTSAFTAASAISYRTQIQLVRDQVLAQMAGYSPQILGQNWQLGAQHAQQALVDLERAYTGITRTPRLREAMRFDPATPRGGALLRSYQTSVDRYGAAMIGQFEQHLALGFAAGLSQYEMVQMLTGHGGPRGDVSMAARVVNGQVVRTRTEQIPEGLFVRHRYWAQRIVRTEGANAYNAARLQRMDAFRDDFPDMKKKILAHFDRRTAWDSIAVHGQVRDLSGPNVFFQDGAGRVYEHPPARPNDRETVIPWREEWGEVTSTAPLTQDERTLAATRIRAGQMPFDPQQRRLSDLQLEQQQTQQRAQRLLQQLEPQLPAGYTITDGGAGYLDVMDAQGAKAGYFKQLPGEAGAAPTYVVTPPQSLHGTHPPGTFTNRIEAARYAIQVGQAISVAKAAAAAQAEAAAAAAAAAEAAAAAKAAKAARAAVRAPFQVEGVAQRLVDKEHRAWLDYVEAERARDGGLRSGALRTAWVKAHAAAYRDAEGTVHAGAPRRTVDYILPPTRRGAASKAIAVPWGEAPPDARWQLASRHDPLDPHARGPAGRPLRAFRSTTRAVYDDPANSVPPAIRPPSAAGPGRYFAGSDYARHLQLEPVDFNEDPLHTLQSPMLRTPGGVTIAADGGQFEGMEVRVRVRVGLDGREYYTFTATLTDDVGDAVRARFQDENASRSEHAWMPTNVRQNFAGLLREIPPDWQADSDSGRDDIVRRCRGASALTMPSRGRTVPGSTGAEVRVELGADHALDTRRAAVGQTRERIRREAELPVVHNRLQVRVYANSPEAALREFDAQARALGLRDPLSRPSEENARTRVRAAILARYDSAARADLLHEGGRDAATIDRLWERHQNTQMRRMETTASIVRAADGGFALYSDALAEEMQERADATHLVHRGTAPNLVEFLANMASDAGGAGLLATTERWERGMAYAGGMSSDEDTGTGGAFGVFTRIRRSQDRPNEDVPYSGGMMFHIDRRELGRMDAFSWNRDRYGRVGTPTERMFPTRTSAPEISTDGNETMLRNGVSMRAINRIELTAGDLPRVLERLRERGVTQIGGRPIEQVLVASRW